MPPSVLGFSLLPPVFLSKSRGIGQFQGMEEPILLKAGCPGKQVLQSCARRCFFVMLQTMLRVGIGYDVHPLVEGRRLVLGGVTIPYSRGLAGHSDADVLIHAICDALLGAIGGGDIGQMFPNTDPRWKDQDSRFFLRQIRRHVELRDGKIQNIDATLIAEEPKLAPYLHTMRVRLAETLEIDCSQVNLKATTNEKLGFIGRGEGIAAMAVALVEVPPHSCTVE